MRQINVLYSLGHLQTIYNLFLNLFIKINQKWSSVNPTKCYLVVTQQTILFNKYKEIRHIFIICYDYELLCAHAFISLFFSPISCCACLCFCLLSAKCQWFSVSLHIATKIPEHFRVWHFIQINWFPLCASLHVIAQAIGQILTYDDCPAVHKADVLHNFVVKTSHLSFVVCITVNLKRIGS